MSEQDGIQPSTKQHRSRKTNTANQVSGKQAHAVQHPANDDTEAWKAYWKAQGQSWRTEPEINEDRQTFLAERRAIRPEIKEGIYPFRGTDLYLSRADLEWLLATHESDGFLGPVNWHDEKQRERKGIDLRGASLAGLDLRELPLARIQGGLTHQERLVTLRVEGRKAAIHLEGAKLVGAHLEGAYLARARLDNSDLHGAYFQHAELVGTHFEGAYMNGTHLEGASLRRAFFNAESELEATILASKEDGTVALAGVRWDNVNLFPVDWSIVNVLEDERNAHRHIDPGGYTKEPLAVLRQYETAVSAYRQLAIVLQNQGLIEEAARFVYRAQLMQRKVFWHQRKFGQYLFSLFLDLLAGYGYKPGRSFISYALVISLFATIYHLLGTHLAWNEAIVISMTAFHGRGFFPDQFHPGDPQALVAALEAFVGLLLEVTFIATLTQRLFRK